jgi:hypothetical protein
VELCHYINQTHNTLKKKKKKIEVDLQIYGGFRVIVISLFVSFAVGAGTLQVCHLLALTRNSDKRCNDHHQ